MSLDSGYFNMSYNCNNYHTNISETNIINHIVWGNYYIRNTITNKEYSLSYVYNSHSNNLELFENDDGYCMAFHIMNRNYDYELIHNSTDIDKEGINCIIKMFNNFINDRNKYVFLYGESKLLHLKKYKRHDLVRLDNRLQFKEGYEFINNSKNITAHRFYVYDFDDDGVILADVGCFASGCNVELGKIYNVPYDWVASMCGEIHNDDIDVLINNKMKLLKPVYGKEIFLSEFNSLMNTNVINDNNIYIELNDNDDPYYIWPGENLYHYNISGSKIWIAVIRCKDFDDTNLFEGNEYEGKIFVNELKTEFYMEGDELEVVRGDISFKHNFITKEITNIKGDKNSIYKSIEAFKRMRESICDYNQYIMANETIINYLKKYF